MFKISAGVFIVTFLHYINFNIFNNNNSLLKYIEKHQSFKANIKTNVFFFNFMTEYSLTKEFGV